MSRLDSCYRPGFMINEQQLGNTVEEKVSAAHFLVSTFSSRIVGSGLTVKQLHRSSHDPIIGVFLGVRVSFV